MPIILGRSFLATSNAIINCQNRVMQLTFGNMTLELKTFHLSSKHEPLEEVYLISTSKEEHCAQERQEELMESIEEELFALVTPPAPPDKA